MPISILVDILEQGFIYALMALGLYISFKILDFPDLSVDGTFPLGAAISTFVLINTHSPFMALLLALIAGALAGLVTGVLHVHLKISPLFSGILTMTMLYSINLLIVGRSNQPFFNQATIFNSGISTYIPESLGLVRLRTWIIAAILCLIFKLALDYFLKSKRGLLLRATGNNPHFVKALGKSSGTMKIIGLMLANALVALSGAVLSQQQNFFEISMGTGILVMGLACVMLGDLFGAHLKFLKGTTLAILGAITYKALVALAIYFGANANFLNLIRGLLFLSVLIFYQIPFTKGGLNHARNKKS